MEHSDLPPLNITHEVSPEDKKYVCDNLWGYNLRVTDGLLKQPDVWINLVLKDEHGQVWGGIFCDTYLYCLYIDVMWLDERCRGQGYGQALINEAERIAREAGCTFAHTSTFSYQSPDFYQRQGYQIYAVLDDFPDGIKEYFLKKKL